MYNSSGVHLPAIDATSDISGVTQLRENEAGTWSATVRLAESASGTIGFEVWAVDASEAHVYEGGTTHTVGQNGNILTIPTHAVSTTYALRSTGPAGGLVFYDKGDYVGGWRYLEAAPADIMLGTDDYYHIFGYYRTTPGGASTEVGTGTGIGTGKANTEALMSKMVTMAYTSYTTSDTTTTGDYAARLCDIHLAGGYDDWFLPSRYELNQMYLNLKAQSVGGFSGYYWSSSEEGHLSAWLQSFSTGNQYDYGKYNDVNIRPARAF